MKRVSVRACLNLALCAVACNVLSPPATAQPDSAAAMRKATEFMMSEVAYKGGFVDKYTADLSEQWGELPARRTMVWVQEPGVVTVGRVLLEVYQATGDTYYLDQCEATAGALIYGQLPEGGWHYFIDFEPEKTQQWYDEIGAHAWGWDEYYHYYGNATFDDGTTAGAADFLLDLYRATLDPKYKTPVLRALDFVLNAQYPLGGWPQRYPLRDDHPANGRPDYTPHYTFNDGVIIDNINVLNRAYDTLGNPAYREAARRGMYFVASSQYGAPQAGWAQQFDMALEPAGARSYEPAGLCPSTTQSNIRHLERFYMMTGDRRFLRGIPDAIAWLREAVLPPGHAIDGATHAQFIEVGTNRPLYAHREGTSRENGRYWVDYEPGNFPGHYGMQTRVDVDAIEAEYKRVAALSPEAARAEYEAAQAHTPAPQTVPDDAAAAIIAAMDDRGAWVEDLVATDHTDWKYKPRRQFRGIATRTYVNNMRTLLHHWQQHASGTP